MTGTAQDTERTGPAQRGRHRRHSGARFRIWHRPSSTAPLQPHAAVHDGADMNLGVADRETASQTPRHSVHRIWRE
jgi:hypothetical protein